MAGARRVVCCCGTFCKGMARLIKRSGQGKLSIFAHKAPSDPQLTAAPGSIWAIRSLAAVVVLGPALVLWGGATFGISRIIYQLVDFAGFAMLAYVALGALVLARLPFANRMAARFVFPAKVWPIALVTLAVSAIGVPLVYHGYALSMDEYMTRLQAAIFGSGQIAVVLPEVWRPFGLALYGGFTSYDAATGILTSNYRPGMAALYAAFDLAGLGPYTSAVLNAVAVGLVARVAHQLYPSDSTAPFLAALLLATSQQALAASLTSYAMTAHLCFNLLWLTLFLTDRLWSLILAAFVGVATASLHQIHPHVFFAAPFLLTLLRPFRPGLVLLYGSVYLAGHAAVYAWDWVAFGRYVAAASPPAAAALAPPDAATAGIFDRVLAMFRLPSLDALTTVLANLARLFGWQSAALVPLLVFAARTIRHDRRLWILVASIALSLLPYPFLMPDQGHGWGYRYLHGLLGLLVLLAVPGWRALGPDRAGAKAAVLCLLILAPVLLVPFRAIQIERFVAPYARATDMLSASKADVVLTDSIRVAIGSDIPRNSPVALRAPVALDDAYLTIAQIRDLCSRFTVDAPKPEAFAAVGLHINPTVWPEAVDWYAARTEALQRCAK